MTSQNIYSILLLLVTVVAIRKGVGDDHDTEVLDFLSNPVQPLVTANEGIVLNPSGVSVTSSK